MTGKVKAMSQVDQRRKVSTLTGGQQVWLGYALKFSTDFTVGSVLIIGGFSGTSSCIESPSTKTQLPNEHVGKCR